MKRFNTEDFKERTKEIYGDLFSFDEDTKYINVKTKVSIICKHHGKVQVQPDNFLNKKSGCPMCAKNKSKTIETFINEANVIHNGKYKYSEAEYVNNHTKLKVICPEHGEFWITPINHLHGKGCPKCCGKNCSSQERIQKLNILYKGFYDYSESDFSKVKEKTTVICPIHGKFQTSFDNHYNRGRGCPKCNHGVALTNDEFLERLQNEFGDKYGTSKCIYKNMHEKVMLTCPIHGDFERTPIELLYFHRGCQKCNGFPLSLECQIKDYLMENQIRFIPQYKQEWLGLLSLDFYLPDYNVAIECQGKQHFGVGGWSKSYDFQEQQSRDERKFRLCLENGIKLLYFSNMQPKYDYFSKVYTNKEDLLQSIRYLYENNA